MTRENLYKVFCEYAEMIEDIYGSLLIFNEDETDVDNEVFVIDGYHCPHCNEPILFVDHEAYFKQSLENFNYCPICEEDLEID